MQFISNEEAGNTKKAELETRAFRRCRQLKNSKEIYHN